MNFLKKNFLLILIVSLAIFLRLYNLSNIPVGFNDDEAAFGYNAYSILKTGRDEWGRLLPFPAFESFGDWKLVLYLYLTVVSVFFFGLGEFSTRLPSAVIGVGTVVAVYFLAREIFGHFDKRPRKTVAVLSSFFLAISPWHIIASRNAFESDLLSFFLSIGTIFFLKSLKKKSYLIFSSIFFVLAFYTYRSSWIFIPLFFLFLLYSFRENLLRAKKAVIKSLAISFILIIPLIPTVLTFKGQSRFVQESFIKGVAKQGIINEVNENRGECTKFIKGICPLIYNKYVYFLSAYVNNYFGNLSYSTFFEKANFTGFQSFATRSVFYIFELPLLLTGILLIIKEKFKAPKLLVAWLILAPVSAAFAGLGNYGRLNLIMPAPQIIGAYGLFNIIQYLGSYRVLAKAFVTLIIVFSFIKFTFDMFLVDPYLTSRYQRYGYKELFGFLNKQGNIDNYYVSSEIDNSHQYIHYLFFQKVDPKFYISEAERSRRTDGWIDFKSIGKYKFIPLSKTQRQSLSGNSLLVTGESGIKAQAKPVKVVQDLRGDTIFEIYKTEDIQSK